MQSSVYRIFPLVFATFVAHRGQAQSQTPSAALLRDFVVPIHATADGVWAAGADYKVRLDERFEFVPALGSAYEENLPVAWTTESVRIGRDEYAEGRFSEVRVRENRYEYRHRGGRLIEAYDLDAANVEQTFLLSSRSPASSGDLVVVGRLDTKLLVEDRAFAHAPIVLRGPQGEAIVEYGAATAVDARGRKFPMASAVVDGRVELRLDADAVAAAEFPLLVDPVLVNSNPSAAAGVVDVAALDQSMFATRSLMTVFTRVNSAADHDVYGVLSEPDFSNTFLALVDLGNSYSNVKVSVGAVQNRTRFVVATDRRQSNNSALACYVQDPNATSLTFISGAWQILPGVSGFFYRNPSVGGAAQGSEALIAYDYSDGARAGVQVARYDVSTQLITATNTLVRSVNAEVSPDVTRRYGTDNWLVTWAESSPAASSVFARAVTAQGLISLRLSELVTSSSQNYSDVQVAGSSGRFVATYHSSPRRLGSPAIRATRFDWPASAAAATVLRQNTIRSGAGLANGGLAVDATTESHWLAAYATGSGSNSSVQAARLGSSGGVVEDVVVRAGGLNGPRAPSVAYAIQRSEAPLHSFAVTYTEDSVEHPILGDPYRYPAVTAQAQFYGGSCATAESEAWDPSIAGDQFFTGTLLQHANTPAACFVSQLSAQTPLDAIGMTGCNLLVVPALGASLPGAPNGSGDPTVSFSLPDSPVFVGPIFTQWVYVQAGANALGVVTNRGVAHDVQ